MCFLVHANWGMAKGNLSKMIEWKSILICLFKKRKKKKRIPMNTKWREWFDSIWKCPKYKKTKRSGGWGSEKRHDCQGFNERYDSR